MFYSAVERLMQRIFGIEDHGQQARPQMAAGDHMEGRRRLAVSSGLILPESHRFEFTVAGRAGAVD